MANRADLEAAAAAGLITAEQIGPLDDFLNTRSSPVRQTLSGEEDLRFIRNFHDVFLAIGIVLFAVGLAIAIATFVASATSEVGQGATMTGVACLTAAAAMWGLSEIFARRRRLFLPAIAIVLSFTGFCVVGAGLIYVSAAMAAGVDNHVSGNAALPPEAQAGILIALAVGVIAPALFYLRFRLPFSLGFTGAMAAAFVIGAVLVQDFERNAQFLPVLYLVLGLLLFAAGVAFDARDPARATRFSDNGFWLHFAAAPLILNGALGLLAQMLTGSQAGVGGSIATMIGTGAAAAPLAIATLIVVALLGFVSLLINRRALLVSALLTTGVAIGILMNAIGLGAGALAATTLIVLGGFVLVLGAGWHVARRALLGWVPPGGVWSRVFPPEVAA